MVASFAWREGAGKRHLPCMCVLRVTLDLYHVLCMCFICALVVRDDKCR
jgi:hypothetical protein